MSKHLSFWHYLLFFILFLIFCGVAFIKDWAVKAEGTPTLTVSPPFGSITINNGNTISLEILATNVVNMYSFEVVLTYDPSILHLDGYILGSMVSTFNWKIIEEMTPPGYFRLSYGQFGGEPVSGDGVLLQLVFSGVNPGTSDITITSAYYTSPDGKKTYPDMENGCVTASYDPGPLEKQPVSGEISLELQSFRGGIPVSLTDGATYRIGPYTALSLSQPGSNLFFGEVVLDTYIITTQQPRYLNLDTSVNKTFTVSATETTINSLELKFGNPEWSDNVVDVNDLDLVDLWFDITAADLATGEILVGDVNFDGLVNVQDLAIVAGRFGLTSADAYAGWVP